MASSKAATAMTVQSSEYKMLEMSDSDMSEQNVMEIESASFTDSEDDIKRASDNESDESDIPEINM